ncbi:MAG: threonine/serine dehydratase [Rhizomicrobium sp.]|jgi:threonine dehydratase
MHDENAQDADIVTLDAVRAAASRIAPFVNATPLVRMTPSGMWLKAESLHPIGAFKIRGAFNALLTLSEDERRRGVVAHSSGNHAQAVAYAAKILGIRATVVMPETSSRLKMEATKRWGAEIVLCSPFGNARAEVTAGIAREKGYLVIEPYDSAAIMAGTGTIGLEILAQKPDVKFVVAPVSGGGLIGGIAAAIAQSDSTIRVVGVEPELANDAAQSFKAKRIVRVPPEDTIRTIADGLRVPQLGRLPWINIRAFVHDIITVSEDAIRAAMRLIAAEAKLVAEPSGAVALAGALAAGLDPDRTVSVLSGGNVDLKSYGDILGG